MTRPRSGWPSPVNLDPARGGWPAALMPGRKQGWPRGINTSADPAENLLSQAVGWWDAAYYTAGDRFLRNRGVAGELLDMRLGSSLAANSNDPLWLGPEAVGYCYLPGVASNYLTVPDEAALDITGDIDLRARVALDDWTPSALQTFVAKYQATGQFSYRMYVNTSGTIGFDFSTDGTATSTRTSTVVSGIVDGSAKWVRAVLDVDNGSAGHDVKFYISDDGVAWSQLGSTVTNAGTVSIFSGTSIVGIGDRIALSGQQASGKFYRAQVLNGIGGTTVLDVDCDALTSGSATSFTATTGQTVTINRSTAGRKTVAMPARGRGGRACFLLGTDDYFECVDNWQHRLLNFNGGDSFTVLAAVRQWGTPVISGPYLHKGEGPPGFKGWGLRQYNGGTTPQPNFFVDDGPNSAQLLGNTYTTPANTAFMGVVNRSAQRAYVYFSGSESASAGISSVLGVESSVSLRVGAQAFGGQNQDFEFTSAAVFRRALTAAEITLLNTYFQNRGF